MKKALKRVIPLHIRLILKQILWLFHINVIRVFSLTGVTASFYYFLFSRKFDREHVSVLRGKLAYHFAQFSSATSSAKLRRNIHRLEKGLIMRPRKPVFAEDYIGETVDSYLKNSVNDNFCLDEKKWAHDVLEEYFSIVGTSEIIDKARQKFILKTDSNLTEKKPTPFFKPYSHEQLPQPAISVEQFASLLKRRRSVRWYQDKEVDFSLIQKAIDLASSAPSACNRQPYRFIVAANRSKAVEIATCAGGTKGFAENFPALIVVVGDLSAYPLERDRHLIYIDGALASMQLVLALETMGISSCFINWPDIEKSEQQIQLKLNIENYERVIMLIAIGYAEPAGGIPYSQKKKNEHLIQRI